MYQHSMIEDLIDNALRTFPRLAVPPGDPVPDRRWMEAYIRSAIQGRLDILRGDVDTEEGSIDDMPIHEERGPLISLSRVIAIPDDGSKYNYVGRILGPRGMTVKQLEEDTGCKILVRGGKTNRKAPPNIDSDRNMPLHVLILCTDYENECKEMIASAAEAINILLHPDHQGVDDFKKNQLVALAMLNGTYRSNGTNRIAAPTLPSHMFMPMPPTQYSRPTREIYPVRPPTPNYNNVAPPFIRDPTSYRLLMPSHSPWGQQMHYAGPPMFPHQLPTHNPVILAEQQQFLQSWYH